MTLDAPVTDLDRNRSSTSSTCCSQGSRSSQAGTEVCPSWTSTSRPRNASFPTSHRRRRSSVFHSSRNRKVNLVDRARHGEVAALRGPEGGTEMARRAGEDLTQPAGAPELEPGARLSGGSGMVGASAHRQLPS